MVGVQHRGRKGLSVKTENGMQDVKGSNFFSIEQRVQASDCLPFYRAWRVSVLAGRAVGAGERRQS